MQVEDIKEFPDQVFHLNVDGSFRKNIRPNAKMEISQYWGSQTKKIGILMLVSTLVLAGIILSETEVLQFFWSIIISSLGSLFNMFVGLF